MSTRGRLGLDCTVIDKPIGCINYDVCSIREPDSELGIVCIHFIAMLVMNIKFAIISY